ncbi:hypothetical protein [Streptomyces sp. Go-475]|uniref:hypothetical protein n=1 Tax=Streptomyces sp. Go-475 TaxID=2072505 RepID=UPI000DF06B25|nr:hypothetical protein [Streptomyces sp. Go-475]AXE85576.1 hypothetical protein C1703_11225 [Streptomyces sp. Go-475]
MPNQLPRCPADGKRSFASPEAASRWLAGKADEFAARPATDSYPKYSYECRRCPFVHVATKPPERATLSRGGRSKSRKNRRRFGGKNG